MVTPQNVASTVGKLIGTGGRGESGFVPAMVETARVVNVNIADWSVDCVGEYGSRRFLDVQVMSPYLHFFNGEGIYVMPEVGAYCWICSPSTGLYAQKFVLGFSAPVDEREDPKTQTQAANFRANRQNLNMGDIMLRTRDENFVILRRGGVIQIGATPATQRMYIPLGNIIRDFCGRYEMKSLAGEMCWQIQRTDEDDAGNVNTHFKLATKSTAADPEHAVVLQTGSLKDNADLRLKLQIWPDGSTDSAGDTVMELTVDKNGAVNWNMSKDFVVNSQANAVLAAEENLTLEARNGDGKFTSKGAMLVGSTSGALDLIGKAAVALESQTAGVAVTGKTIGLNGKTAVGGAGGEPLVKGIALLTFLSKLIEQMTNPSKPGAPATMIPGLPVLHPVMASLVPEIQNLLSTNNTTT